MSDGALVRLRALVVDDEQPIRRALELTLTRAGVRRADRGDGRTTRWWRRR